MTRLEAEPGIVVIRSERDGGKWHLTGMRDPLARNPSLLLASRGVDTNDVVARWEPYVSTEPALLLDPSNTTSRLSSELAAVRNRVVLDECWRRLSVSRSP